MPDHDWRRAAALSSHSEKQRRQLGVAALLAVCAMLAVAYFSGRELRASRDARNAQTVNEENAEFCGRLNAGPASRNYGDCIAALNELRRRHDQRMQAAAAGLL